MNAAVDAIIEEQSCLFDLIVFDCPPGFSLLTEAALARSDLIILPTAPNNLGTQGLLAFIKYLENDLDLVDSSSRTYAFVTMTRRTTTSNEFERAVRAESRKVNQRYQVLKHTFPYLDAFQKATDRRHQRMRVIGAVQRALSNWRHRTLFERLYQGVDGYVLRVVNEVWDVINQERVDNERVRTRASRRQDRQPETSV
jgi:cellulose biosynthesis protein BcsQ